MWFQFLTSKIDELHKALLEKQEGNQAEVVYQNQNMESEYRTFNSNVEADYGRMLLD